MRAAFALAVVPAAASVAGASAAMAASGRIEFRIARAGLIFGLGGGTGALLYKGERYPLRIGGVSFGATIGVSSADFVGRVRNLKRPGDIEGTYSAIGSGVAVAGGAAVARLRNARGVELEVSGRQAGFKFSVDLSGLRIRLKD
ncbi:MAG: hypothetical protein ACKOED_12390 [Aestuariivirga sp.]|uniref:hypothetical protein n=1 Tax=Aestuariivirga sp. TaxID=2650926 RepID=UPI0038D08FA2